MWRVVLSDRIPDDYHTIAHKWTLDELVDAHLVLDAIAAVEAASTPKAPR